MVNHDFTISSYTNSSSTIAHNGKIGFGNSGIGFGDSPDIICGQGSDTLCENVTCDFREWHEAFKVDLTVFGGSDTSNNWCGDADGDFAFDCREETTRYIDKSDFSLQCWLRQCW